jgi:hypothetical protein
MLSPQLERAFLVAVLREWAQMNRERFRSALHAPVFALSGTGDSVGTNLGLWSSAGRTLLLDRYFVVHSPWPAVREVLLHEMAHQFVDEVYKVRDESPHGPTFQAVCARFAIDPRASGAPLPASEAAPDQDRVVARVRKLLALAASANQHEAESAMNAAQALLLKYNLDFLDAPQEQRMQWRTVGEPALRHAEDAKVLGAILARHFFVKGVWVPAFLPRRGEWGSVFEICGSSENLEMALYVYDFLQATTLRLWEKDGVGHTRTALARFRAGAYHGFFQKLNEQSVRQAETGLVWVGDPRLESWFGQRHPHIRTVKSTGFKRDSDFQNGRIAGRGIVLNRPITATEGRSLQLEDKRRG